MRRKIFQDKKGTFPSAYKLSILQHGNNGPSGSLDLLWQHFFKHRISITNGVSNYMMPLLLHSNLNSEWHYNESKIRTPKWKKRYFRVWKRHFPEQFQHNCGQCCCLRSVAKYCHPIPDEVDVQRHKPAETYVVVDENIAEVQGNATVRSSLISDWFGRMVSFDKNHKFSSNHCCFLLGFYQIY